MRVKGRYPCSVPSVWRAVVVLLVLVISVLQVVHITLLSRLEAKRGLRRSPLDSRDSNVRIARSPLMEYDYYGVSHIQEDKAKMLQMVENSNILDISGEYHIINDFLASSNALKGGGSSLDVTLVTQCTLNHLAHLQSVSTQWQGPIAVTVFTLARDLPTLVESILQLRTCFPSIRHNVSFHLVYPLHSKPLPPGASRRGPTLSAGECSSLNTRLSKLVSKENYAQGVSYPVNLLRNVARKNAKTQFVFVIDADLQVNQGLREKFVSFAKENSLTERADSHRVFVVPAFEAPETLTKMPKDKQELTALLQEGKARPFYQELCHKCHKHTDYEAWLKAPQGDGRVTMLYQVAWKDPWEPFYISSNKVPLYDERFRQYGFNRISQTCELHVVGYTFEVLNNAFLIHRGLKQPGGFHKGKEADLERNRQNFRQFKNELKDKYKNSPRRCY